MYHKGRLVFGIVWCRLDVSGIGEIETMDEIMQINELRPRVSKYVAFRPSVFDKVPDAPGYYVLVGSSGEILYIGQSEISIRDRFWEHLGDESKKGVARFCYGLNSKPRRTEREWLDQYARRSRGNKPPLHD